MGCCDGWTTFPFIIIPVRYGMHTNAIFMIAEKSWQQSANYTFTELAIAIISNVFCHGIFIVFIIMGDYCFLLFKQKLAVGLFCEYNFSCAFRIACHNVGGCPKVVTYKETPHNTLSCYYIAKLILLMCHEKFRHQDYINVLYFAID